MAIDQRSWYRDLLRKRTGYTERARFRMSDAEIERSRWRAAWHRNFWVFVLVVLIFIVIRALLRAQ